jgi:hypothetical protein
VEQQHDGEVDTQYDNLSALSNHEKGTVMPSLARYCQSVRGTRAHLHTYGGLIPNSNILRRSVLSTQHPHIHTHIPSHDAKCYITIHTAHSHLHRTKSMSSTTSHYIHAPLQYVLKLRTLLRDTAAEHPGTHCQSSTQ